MVQRINKSGNVESEFALVKIHMYIIYSTFFVFTKLASSEA